MKLIQLIQEEPVLEVLQSCIETVLVDRDNSKVSSGPGLEEPQLPIEPVLREHDYSKTFSVNPTKIIKSIPKLALEDPKPSIEPILRDHDYANNSNNTESDLKSDVNRQGDIATISGFVVTRTSNTPSTMTAIIQEESCHFYKNNEEHLEEKWNKGNSYIVGETEKKIKTEDEYFEVQSPSPNRKRLKLDLSLSPLKTEAGTDDEISKNTLESTPDVKAWKSNSQSSNLQDSPHQLNTSHCSHNNELNELRARVKEKEEKLRQLKLLSVYQKENSLEELSVQVDKWKQVAQSAAMDLYEQQKSSYEDTITLENFLQQLDIDASLIDME